MHSSQTGKSFYDYLEILLRRKWLLIIPSVIGLVASIIVAGMLTEYYRSTTMILIEEQQVSESYVTPTDLTPVSSRLNTLSQQIMSRTRLESIAKEFNLFDDADKKSTMSRLLARLGLDGNNNRGVSKEAVISNLRNNIEVKILNDRRRRGGSGGEAFRISYVGKDPNTTMNITSTIASLYIEENLKVREQYAEGTSDFLNGELNKAKLELEEQEVTLRHFKENHMGSLPEQLDANLRTLDRLQFELQSIHDGLQNSQERKMLLESRLHNKTQNQPGTEYFADPLETRLGELETELHNLRSTYNDIYPDVIIVKNRIADQKALIARQNGSVVDETTDKKALTNSGTDKDISAAQEAANEIDKTKKTAVNTEGSGVAAKVVGAKKFNLISELSLLNSKIKNYTKKENDVRALIKNYERRVEVTPENEQMMIDIRRDYDISLQNYRSLLEKKLNARLAANLEKKQKGARFRVIDPANLPESPFKPDKKKVVGMGLLAGCGVGVGLIFLLEFLNPAFRKPEDFNGILDIPVLAMIPHFQPEITVRQAKKLRIIKGRKELSSDDDAQQFNKK